jgi:hypothetical protein
LRKAGLHPDLLPAFRLALQAAREASWVPGSDLSREAVRRVLVGCQRINSGELDKLMVMLRRFESEAARDETRAAVAARPSDTGPEPLLLRELDTPAEGSSARFGEPRLLYRERRPLQIDLAAIEAELQAA